MDAVDPAAVQSWEPWESCLISVGAAEVDGVNDYNEALLSNGLKIDDFIWEFDVEAGASLAGVTGQLNYSFEEWKHPRGKRTRGHERLLMKW